MDDDNDFWKHLHGADRCDSDDEEVDVLEFLDPSPSKVEKRRHPVLPKLAGCTGSIPSSAKIPSTHSRSLRRVTLFPLAKAKSFIPPTLKSSSSAPPRTKDTMPRPTLKKQKTSGLSLIPEQLQFFKGHNLCVKRKRLFLEFC